jgi:hypothetical protein
LLRASEAECEAAYSYDVRDPKTSPAIDGTCLCGAVGVGVAAMPRQVTQCNCAACRKYGTLWAYYKRSQVAISAPRGGLQKFVRTPSGVLWFVRCVTCGCVINWQRRRGHTADARMGVNARLFEAAKMANVPITVLDGDEKWLVLEKYTKPGIWLSPTRTGRS